MIKLGTPMKFIRENIFLLILIFFFFFIRFWNLENSINFGTDQGLAIMESYKLFQTKKITLIGATGSSWTVSGRYIFFASYPYFLYLPILIISHWNPLSLSYLFICLNFLVLLFAYFTIVKYLKNKSLAIIFSTIFTFTSLLIYHSQFVWSPNLLIIISTLSISLLIILGKTKRNKNIFLFLTGMILGIGTAIRFSFLGAIILAFIWIYRLQWLKLKHNVIISLGFLLGFSPLIIFDLRHDFYNLKTVLIILTSAKNIPDSPVFKLNFHYLLPFVPFIIYLVSKILVRAGKINKLIPIIFLSAVIINSLKTILPLPSHGYNMTTGWNYKGIKKLDVIIRYENLNGYNLVDLLTGDTRAMALRSLLTVADKPPLGITDYPATDYLFVYSKDGIEKILSGSLWEVDSVRPVKLTKEWNIQNGISLYLLERQKSKSF